MELFSKFLMLGLSTCLITIAGCNKKGNKDGDDDPPAGDAYTFVVNNNTETYSWLNNDSPKFFAWVWQGEVTTDHWVSASINTETNAISFSMDELPGGFLLVRCQPDTTEPGWSITGDGAGRIYNKTVDYTVTADVFTYEGNWFEYYPA